MASQRAGQLELHQSTLASHRATTSKISVCWSTTLQWITAAHARKQVTATSKGFIAALVRHSWPGKVRELQDFT
jgi:transcriptional regulator with PAS, ATPase and Fis domain